MRERGWAGSDPCAGTAQPHRAADRDWPSGRLREVYRALAFTELRLSRIRIFMLVFRRPRRACYWSVLGSTPSG